MPHTRTPAMKRDPHLPSPEVCDWLLSQEWSAPDTFHISSGGRKPGYITGCCVANAAVGHNETIDLLLPSSGLRVLREDQAARAAALQRLEALVLKTASAPVPPENPAANDDAEPGIDTLNGLADKLLDVIHDTAAPIPVSIAALEVAKAVFLSQIYDLRPQPEVTP